MRSNCARNGTNTMRQSK